MAEPLLDLDPTLNHCPGRVRTIHLMGVCGTAMAALAGMLKQSGYEVRGSDANVYPPMSDFLDRIGVDVCNGYAAANLAAPIDLVIVGNVISRPNPEAQALAAARLPYLSMPQALRRFYIEGKRSLVVAGTHGKTTTSSMLAAALFAGGGDPGFMIGGIVDNFSANYRIGAGPYFVCEGDEYDTAFFDKGSKFLHYRPDVAILTSLEFDHADIFADLGQIKRSFRDFIRLLPADGLIIACGDDPEVAEVVTEAPCPVERYGRSAAVDWRVDGPRFAPGRSSFELFRRGDRFAAITVSLSGMHNCLNAAAVAAVMHHLGFGAAQIEAGLGAFSGVRRRQEVRGTIDDIVVIDDFAHHPTAVRETLRGLRQAYRGRRLICVFEPRTNTSRRSLFQDTYAASFGDADISLIRDVADDKPTEAGDRFSAALLAADLRSRGQEAAAFADTDRIIDHLDSCARPGDVIAILSNGGFDNIHARLLNRLEDHPRS